MTFEFERARLAVVSYILAALILLASGVRYLFVPLVDDLTRIGLVAGVIFIALGIFLDPERIKNALSGRQGRYGSNAVLYSIAFTGILVVLNVLAANYPQRLDLTEDQEFSLTRETELLLSELRQPIHLIGFYSPDRTSSRDQIRPVLDLYEQHSDGLVTFEFIDPRSDPLAADLYGITRDGSMAVVVGEESQVVDFPSELEITSAIVGLTNPESRAVYFLTGHGEPEFDSSGDAGLGQLVNVLERKNYLVDQLNLLVQPEIPGDAVVLVIAAPQRPLAEEELQVIDGYLAQGGSLLAMLEPTASFGLEADQEQLNDYLGETWGIHARNDIVVDLASALDPLIGLSASYGSHRITQRMQGLGTLYPTVRSIEDTQADSSDLAFAGLVMSSERSWGETDFAGVSQLEAQFDEETEAAGPLIMAATVTDPSRGTRVVVIGDADFASNGWIMVGGNQDFAVNSIDWAAKQDNLIDITPRPRTTRQVLPATRSTVLLLVIGTAVLIPGGILAAGGRVWWNRRKQT